MKEFTNIIGILSFSIEFNNIMKFQQRYLQQKKRKLQNSGGKSLIYFMLKRLMVEMCTTVWLE